jgi:hypothetical protein
MLPTIGSNSGPMASWRDIFSNAAMHRRWPLGVICAESNEARSRPEVPQSRQPGGSAPSTQGAMCGRPRVGKGFLHVCSGGRSSHVFCLLARFT